MAKRVYLEAARRVAEGEDSFACNAIDSAVGIYGSRERDAFTAVFAPENDTWGAWLTGENTSFEEDRHVRVIALCLAAEAL